MIKVKKDKRKGASMATREGTLQIEKKKFPLIPLLSLLCFTSIFFLLSQFKSTSTPNHSLPTFQIQHHHRLGSSCDYSDGTWIHDPSRTPWYDNTCKEIFKGWNCLSSHKSNAPHLATWRWQPRLCDLPQFDPAKFLRTHTHINIGFVGDSLNRNMFVSLFCSLKSFSDGQIKKWRPAGADRGFTFLAYNLTIAYHRTNLFARYGSWSASDKHGALETLGFREGYRVHVDVPETTWAQALSFHN